MAEITDAALKLYFETGDVPTADQFVDFIDSKVNKPVLASTTGAGLVGYNSGETGDAGRTVQSRLRDMASVKDFGATGDGSTDDTTAIQAAITSRRSLYWPAGDYRVGTALTFPTTTIPGGIVWMGEGSTRSNPQTATRDGALTRLTWAGAASGTMIAGEGLANLSVNHMTFVGRPTAGGDRAGILWLFKDNASFGVGHSQFNDVTFFDATVCVQVNEASGDTDGDTIVFNKVEFNNSDTGFLSKNTQALLYSFYDLGAVSTTTVIDMEQGGNLVVMHAGFSICGGTSAGEFVIKLQNMATNAHTAYLVGLRPEQNTSQILQASGYGKIIIENYNEAQSDQNENMFYIDGPTVQFRGSSFKTNDATTRPFKLEQHAGGYRPAMLFTGCEFPVAISGQFDIADWFEIESTAFHTIKIEDCTYNGNGLKLPNVNNAPEYGPAHHYVRTTDETPTYAYFDGGTTASVSNTLQIPTDSTWVFDVYILGLDSTTSPSESVMYRRQIVVLNDAGTVSIDNTQTIGTDYEHANLSGCAAPTIAASSTFIRAQVTGIADTTIDWRVIFDGHALVE